LFHKADPGTHAPVIRIEDLAKHYRISHGIPRGQYRTFRETLPHLAAEQMRRLFKFVAGRTAEEMRNHLEFLSDWDGTLSVPLWCLLNTENGLAGASPSQHALLSHSLLLP
jgi:hypothetical protein